MVVRVVEEKGEGTISSFPGNSNVCVIYDVFVEYKERGKGLGQQYHQHRLDVALEQGYNYALCTVHPDNEAEKHILLKNGWELLKTFDVCDCDHQIHLFGRTL